MSSDLLLDKEHKASLAYIKLKVLIAQQVVSQLPAEQKVQQPVGQIQEAEKRQQVVGQIGQRGTYPHHCRICSERHQQAYWCFGIPVDRKHPRYFQGKPADRRAN